MQQSKNISPELFGHLETLSRFIDQKMGLNFPKNRYQDLTKKIKEIAKAFEFKDIISCINWITSPPFNEEKFEKLAGYLTIGETYFFRDKSLFATLEQIIFPKLIEKHRRDRTLRIWSAGCSSGEEVYSIAILLHRMIPDIQNWNIHLFGTDINKDSIRKAQSGSYKKWSFRAIPEDLKKRYFIKEDSTYTVIPELKKMVKFFELNLVEPTYPDSNNGTAEVDLIVCHNVLMYFTPDQIKKTIHQLTKALTENGWFSVTPIEVPFVDEEYLTPHKLQSVIFTKSAKKHRSTKFDKIALTLPIATASTKKKLEDKGPLTINQPKNLKIEKPLSKNPYKECLQAYMNKDYPFVISNLIPFLSPSRKNSEFMRAHLNEIELLIRTYANQGDVKHALEWCEEILQHEKLHPLLHYWHGALLEAKGEIESAIKALKKTLFIDPNFVMAHYMLGELEKLKKNTKASVRNFEKALELIEEGPDDKILTGTEELTYGYLKDILINNLRNGEVIKHAKK